MKIKKRGLFIFLLISIGVQAVNSEIGQRNFATLSAHLKNPKVSSFEKKSFSGDRGLLEAAEPLGVPEWFTKANGYQIYVRSFLDTNGDGFGDLAGVASKINYFKYLGIDLIWFNPVYPSPNFDWGYDVSDYFSIHPDFGTLPEFINLVDNLHKNGIRVLNDLVVAHTSDQNQWFINSVNRVPGFTDFYIWADGPAPGVPPTDEQSMFGGSAWTFSPIRGQWYFHVFLPQQPNLNYADPAVIAQMQEVVSFWLNLGVDGFRVDAVDTIQPASATTATLKALRSTLDQFNDRVFLAESFANFSGSFSGDGSKNPVNYKGYPLYFSDIIPKGELLNSNFDFTPLSPALVGGGKIEFSQAYTSSHVYQQFFDSGLLSYASGNHDLGRAMSEYIATVADVALQVYAYRAFLTMNYVTRMMPMLCYGDEIGLIAPAFNIFEQPPCATFPVWGWLTTVTANQLSNPYVPRDNVLTFFDICGFRDPFRTPMQWNSNFAENAGFSTGTPWIPLTSFRLDSINVETQIADKKSTLNMLKQLIALRKKCPILTGHGQYTQIDDLNYPDLFIIQRNLGENKLRIVINMGRFDVPSNTLTSVNSNYKSHIKGKILFSNYMDRTNEEVNNCIALRPFEAMIIKPVK